MKKNMKNIDNYMLYKDLLKQMTNYRNHKIHTLEWKNDDVNKFIMDVNEKRINDYTKEDWDKIITLSKNSRLVCDIIMKNHDVPLDVFKAVLPRFTTTEYMLHRQDYSNEDIEMILNILGPNRVKETLDANIEYVSDNVINYMIMLPNEKLAEYDFLPLQYMTYGSRNAGKVLENYKERFDGYEQAFTAIANNMRLMDDIRTDAFLYGGVLEHTRSMTPEVSKSIYSCCAETLFDPEVLDNELKDRAEKTILYMIRTHKLTTSCELDLVQRYKESPKGLGRLIEKLAQLTSNDETMVSIAELKQLDCNRVLTINKNLGIKAGKRLYEVHPVNPEKKKILISAITSQKGFAPELADEIIATGDRNLIKALIVQSNQNSVLYHNIKTVYNEYKAYFDFIDMLYEKTNPIIGYALMNDNRRQLIIHNFFANDKSMDEETSKVKKDKKGYEIVSRAKLLSYQTMGNYNFMGITKEERELLKGIVNELGRQYTEEAYRNPYYENIRESENIATIRDFGIATEITYADETIRRKHSDLCRIVNIGGNYSISVKSLMELETEQLEKLAFSMSKEERYSELKKICSQITSEMILLYQDDSDKLQYAIYKLTPLYEAIKERYLKLELEEKEAEEKEKEEEEYGDL